MDDVEIRRGYFPGSIGLVLELHARYYHAHLGFGVLFEAQLARGLAEFFGRYDELRDGFWIAAVSEQVEGSITIDGAHAADAGAHLRCFIMSDALRGKGVGTRLIHTAVDSVAPRNTVASIFVPLRGSMPHGTFTRRWAFGSLTNARERKRAPQSLNSGLS
jgi:GNAT superfamily N-acetyltransferase